MSERSGVVIATVATVAAMAVLLAGPQVSAHEPADRPAPVERAGR
jgi:hypothetical protein